MSDLHDLLERKARAFRPDDDGLEHLLRRADRRHRRRRVTSATVALAVAAVGAFGVFTMLRGPAETTGRLNDGGAAAYHAIWPHPDYEVAVDIQRRANADDPAVQWEQQANEVVAKFALDGLGWVNVWVDPLPPAEVAGNGPATQAIRGCRADEVNSESDVLYCPDEKLKDGTVTIERLLQKNTDGIWSVTDATVEGRPVDVEPAPVPAEGTDPDEENTTIRSDDDVDSSALSPVAQLVTQFVDSRREGTNYARSVLAPEAAVAYDSREGGLDLYGYAQGPDVTWVVDTSGPDSPDSPWFVTISIFSRGNGSEEPDVVEVVSVGPSDAGPLRILTAERVQ